MLSSTVQGAWASLVQPIILTLGAAFGALDMDVAPVIDVNWLGWLKLGGIREEKARTHTMSSDEKEEEEIGPWTPGVDIKLKDEFKD